MQNYIQKDWFSQNIPNFEDVKKILTNRKDILEIGCFEGRSTTWMLENFLETDGKIVCVDPFEGSPEHSNIDLSDLEKRWSTNVESVRKKTQICKLYKMKSYDALAHLITEKSNFDFIYVDGSHTAIDVLTDACMCAGLLRVGGVILFDDYNWPLPVDWPPGLTVLETPKPALNAFASIYDGVMQPVLSNYQVAFKKIK